MKTRKLLWNSVLFSPLLFLFIAHENPGAAEGGIKGVVLPADQVNAVWSVNGSDSVKATVMNGTFTIQPLKAGNYSVYIDAKDEFNDALVEDISVTDNNQTDIGQLVLKRK